MKPAEELLRTDRAERDALLALLKDAPPRQAIDDQRYWVWRTRVDALLLRITE